MTDAAKALTSTNAGRVHDSGAANKSEAAAEAESSFKSLGLSDPLCEACAKLGYKKPSDIQAEAIPWALQDRDIIGLAETGSGKTAAFALPVLHRLLEKPQALFGLVVSPTREKYRNVTH